MYLFHPISHITSATNLFACFHLDIDCFFFEKQSNLAVVSSVVKIGMIFLKQKSTGIVEL